MTKRPATERVVHFLRHGPPVRTGLLLGHTDEPALLDACPRIRARVLPLSIAQIVAADLRRASAQASILAHDLGVPLTLDPAWRELNFGTWDGLAPEAVDQSTLARFWNDPQANPPPLGERWSDLCERVAQALARLQTDSLVVSHAGAIRAAVSLLTGLDHRGGWAFDLPYGALLTLRIWPGEPPSGQITGLVTEAPR